MKKFILLLILGLILFNIVFQPILLNAESSSGQKQQKETVEIGKTDLILILLAVILIILIL
ncbi:MAG: hypothetical protein RMJ67_04900 [Elusimicrobiota bacterium]|nr:hypothetical protein [Endomicrobiia bacterium]MDW8165826.1 hypothetical protein [Elusimicrobiota bacterium]